MNRKKAKAMRKFLLPRGHESVSAQVDGEGWGNFTLYDGTDSVSFYGDREDLMKKLERVEEAIQFIRENAS